MPAAADPGQPERRRPPVPGLPPVPGRHERRSAALDTVRALFWLLAMGVIVAFAFFALVGTVDVREAWIATTVVAVLVVLWIIHGVLDHRHREELRHDPRLRVSRERRGF